MIQINQLRQIKNKVEAEKGEFVLFGLFLRDEAVDKWDLVVSAPWLEKDKMKGLGEFVKKMASVVGEDEVLTLSRIVTLNHDDPSLEAILQDVQVENDLVEMQGHNLFGLPISQAYILQAKQPLSMGSMAA
ncbi:MAG: hypothetical protein JST85_17285 [Acidobacteria bacterium]|nr:hypothetical protein [Acidobacteriota bacterium]